MHFDHLSEIFLSVLYQCFISNFIRITILGAQTNSYSNHLIVEYLTWIRDPNITNILDF